MRFVYGILLAVLMFQPATGQHTAGIGEKLKTLSLNDTISSVAIDRPGDFYVVTRSGQIQRFDQDGSLSLLYRTDKAPTLFDPRDGARLFVYRREDQSYEFLNPSFEPLLSYRIDPAFAIQPWLICPSGEYKLWILDQADQSLKKVNVKASEVEVEVITDPAVTGEAGSFIAMREYQNFLFLLNPAKGIFIFNSLGKHIRTIDAHALKTFNFLGEELYYLQGNTLQLFNLFTAATRQIEIPPGYANILLTGERAILFSPKEISIFAFRP